jgi:hypothetical protein
MPIAPIEAANSTAQLYYLLSFDKNDDEVDDTTQDKPSKDSRPNPLSQKALAQMADAAAAGEPIKDVFILSHQWLTTPPESQAPYDAWIALLEQAKATDIDPEKPIRPLTIAIHLPKPDAPSAKAPSHACRSRRTDGPLPRRAPGRRSTARR